MQSRFIGKGERYRWKCARSIQNSEFCLSGFRFPPFGKVLQRFVSIRKCAFHLFHSAFGGAAESDEAKVNSPRRVLHFPLAPSRFELVRSFI